MKPNLAFLFVAVAPLLFSYDYKPEQESSSTPQYVIDYNAGLKAQKNKDYETAMTFYQKALDEKPDYSNAWNGLGFCNRMIAKSYLAKSGDAYGQAIKYSPDSPYALEYQGEYFLMVGQIKKAYQNFLKLQQLSPKEAKNLKEKLDPILHQSQDVLKSYSP